MKILDDGLSEINHILAKGTYDIQSKIMKLMKILDGFDARVV